MDDDDDFDGPRLFHGLVAGGALAVIGLAVVGFVVLLVVL